MSDEHEAGVPPILRGRLEVSEADGLGVVRIEMVLDAPVAEVWAAVTEPEGLAGWAGAITGDLTVGGQYHAALFPSGWEGDGRVVECEPGRRWLVEGAEPKGPVHLNELVLERDGDRTRVVVTESGIDPAMLHFYGVGVQLHVENLAAHLAGGDPVDPDPFWAALLPEYERIAGDLR